MKIVILGAGNVAWHLSKAFKNNGHTIHQIYSRSDASAHALGKEVQSDCTSSLAEIKTDADFYLIAVKDEAIASSLNKLTFNPALIAHTSGSMDMSVFPKHFSSTGIFYPLQTFSKNIPVDLNKVPICIEGNSATSTDQLRAIANSISSAIHELNSSQRIQLHLAAVFANNFTNYLYSIAEDLLQNKNIPASILNELILETARKAIAIGPAQAQTGPAKRGDSTILEKHLDLLQSHPDKKEIYRIFSECIMQKYGKNL